jgi:hypothetical protein
MLRNRLPNGAAPKPSGPLTPLREQGVIKAWGLSVNTVEPCELALDMAEALPDGFLLAGRYRRPSSLASRAERIAEDCAHVRPPSRHESQETLVSTNSVRRIL